MASDSLAAESVRAGGDFASNRDAAPMGVKGANSTLANTDTSGAVTLEAAPDRPSRGDEGLDERVKYPEGTGGQGGGKGGKWKGGDVGGPEGGKKEGSEKGSTGGEGGIVKGEEKEERSKASKGGDAGGADQKRGEGKSAGTGDSAGGEKGTQHVDTAPSYVHAGQAAGGKPKGKNLTEGGFDDDDGKNASFTSNIGDENDPGRLAENKFEQENAESAAYVGGGPRQKKITGDGQYASLEDDQQL